MRSEKVLAVVVGLAVLVSASCSATANGNPVPESDATRTTESSEERPTDAPEVSNPLDFTAFLPRPCAVLTESQLTTLGIDRAGFPTTTGALAEQGGPWCSWLQSDSSDAVNVALVTFGDGGLDAVYASRDNFKYFEPTTVAEYPAVFAAGTDSRAQGECQIVVGISDSETIRIDTRGSLDARGACDRVKQVAAAVLTTIREG